MALIINLSELQLSNSITYNELKTLRDNNGLIMGNYYRISDYTTTTTKTNTQSAGNVFDVIVLADSSNSLNENAIAKQRSGDTYFVNSNLSMWKLKYSLDNDTNKFEWADAVNGKGVIYYMKDEWGNECPYDFKNIKFKKSDKYLYTFIKYVTDTDNSISGNSYNNVINSYIINGKNILNNILLYNDNYNNYIGFNCYNIFIYGNSFNNKFGNYCYNFEFDVECNRNTFGDYNFNINLYSSCVNNIFGNNCGQITLNQQCSDNIIGNDCSNFSFDTYSSNNKIQDGCKNFLLDSYQFKNIVYQDNTKFRDITSGIELSIGEGGIFQNNKKNNKPGFKPINIPNYSTQISILPQTFGDYTIYQKVIFFDSYQNDTQIFFPNLTQIISVKGYYYTVLNDCFPILSSRDSTPGWGGPIFYVKNNKLYLTNFQNCYYTSGMAIIEFIDDGSNNGSYGYGSDGYGSDGYGSSGYDYGSYGYGSSGNGSSGNDAFLSLMYINDNYIDGGYTGGDFITTQTFGWDVPIYDWLKGDNIIIPLSFILDTAMVRVYFSSSNPTLYQEFYLQQPNPFLEVYFENTSLLRILGPTSNVDGYVEIKPGIWKYEIDMIFKL